jgi:hypothetical protein
MRWIALVVLLARNFLNLDPLSIHGTVTQRDSGYAVDVIFDLGEHHVTVISAERIAVREEAIRLLNAFRLESCPAPKGRYVFAIVLSSGPVRSSFYSVDIKKKHWEQLDIPECPASD